MSTVSPIQSSASSWQSVEGVERDTISSFAKPTLSATSTKSPPPLENRVSVIAEDKEAICGVVGTGDRFRTVRVTWLNGANYSQKQVHSMAEKISKMFGGVRVHYLYNQSYGALNDYYQATWQKFWGNEPALVKDLATHFRKVIQELGGVKSGGRIVHITHSHGALITDMAKKYLQPEERAMIDVITFGGIKFITKEDYGSAINYINNKDLVALINFSALAVWYSGKPTDEIVCLNSTALGYFDHAMRYGTTYRAALLMEADRFRSTYDPTWVKMSTQLSHQWNDLECDKASS